MSARKDLDEYALAKMVEHDRYVREHGDDMPEIAGWRWGSNG
jgi:xylulose-5-phosphate/fructose-6-phosphate phosphoketolase